MKNQLISNANAATNYIHRNSPAILTGLGIIGLVTSVVMTAKVAPKAHDILQQKKEEQQDKEMTKGQIIWDDTKAVAPLYFPVALSVAASSACIIGSYKISTKRLAAMSTAYILAEGKLAEYQAKVIEKLGEEKEKMLRDEIKQEQIDNDPYAKNEVIIDGDELFYDLNGGRYFRSTEAKLNKIESRLNRRLMYEEWISLNDFYYEIGMPPTKLGDEFGWNIGDEIDLEYAAHISGETACKSVEFNTRPRYDYTHG